MESLKWWQKGVIYQIYPRSFASSKQKAIGDLQGITDKMGYLQKLGVDAIWISPFFQSPMKDYGYDVSDYTAVDPLFGSIADFDNLLTLAHQKGLKVIIDQVYNHSSDQHTWFQESKKSKENSKADWYVWTNPKKDGNPPNNWLSVFGGAAWTWNSKRQQYYLHQFLKEQPDLNFNNPEVVEAILQVVEFWLKKGVDGFRLDTVNFYTQDEQLRNNPPLENQNEKNLQSSKENPYFYQQHLYDRPFKKNIFFLEKLRALADQYQDKMYMGEIGDANPLPILEEYTKGNKRLHTAYTFILLEQIINPQRIASAMQKVKNQQGWPCWAFSNHDVVRSISRMNIQEKDYQSAAKMLISLLCSLRGTPCLYQGEELGLPEAEIAFEDLQDPYGKNMWPEYKGRDGCRTPMPWNGALSYAGFSKEKPWLPVSDIHKELAIAGQLADENSSLCYTQKFLQWRKTQPLLHSAAELEVEKVEENYLIFVRKEQKQAIRIVCNFGHETIALLSEGEIVFASDTATTKKQIAPYSACFIKF